MHSARILFFGYANKTVAPPGAICEFSAEGACRLLYLREGWKEERIQDKNM